MPAIDAVMITRLGSLVEAFFCNNGANLMQKELAAYLITSLKGGSEERIYMWGHYNRTVLNTLLTFKSITFANAASGCVSNFSPHVAPALANKTST